MNPKEKLMSKVRVISKDRSSMATEDYVWFEGKDVFEYFKEVENGN